MSQEQEKKGIDVGLRIFECGCIGWRNVNPQDCSEEPMCLVIQHCSREVHDPEFDLCHMPMKRINSKSKPMKGECQLEYIQKLSALIRDGHKLQEIQRLLIPPQRRKG